VAIGRELSVSSFRPGKVKKRTSLFTFFALFKEKYFFWRKILKKIMAVISKGLFRSDTK